MSEISAMPAAIVAWLKTRAELSQMVFYTDFPNIKKAIPLKKITVAVGFKQMNIEDNFTADGNEVFENEEYCREAQITLKFTIHAPFSMGGNACNEAYADIINCLVFASTLNVVSAGCTQIKEDRETDAFILAANLVCKASFCPAEETGLDFPSFADKTLLCGSHINNAEIHLSQSQREYIEAPVTYGVYYGDGDNTISITLGFKPKAVKVFAKNFAPCVFESNSTQVYSAFAVGNSATVGIEITSTGFTCKNGSNYTSHGATPYLNKPGITYWYEATKR